MRISLIVAVADNDVIGVDGDLPWRLSTDLRRFKALTVGHTVVMGRKTHESIGRPLPDRRNLVLSRRPGYEAPGCEIFADLPSAIQAARQAGESDLFVIGGAAVYAEALPLADRLHLTRVRMRPEGDTRFPALDEGWIERSREEVPADERNEADSVYLVLDRSPA